MKHEVKVPEVGESVTEGVLASWHKEDGDQVEKDEELFELETDKVTMSVPSEAAGRLSIQVEAGSKVTIGQVVAVIETEAEAAGEPEQAARPEARPERKPAPAAEPEARPEREPAGSTSEAAPERRPEEPAARRPGGPPLTTPAGRPQMKEKLHDEGALAELSPAVRRLVEEHELDPSAIEATGKDGRLTKDDVLRHLARGPAPTARVRPSRESIHVEEERQPAAPRAAAPAETPRPRLAPAEATAEEEKKPGERRQTRRSMSTLRQRIAERLVQAQQTAAILTTFNEADMTNLLETRSRHKEAFEKRHGVRLGIMSFFVKAAVDALREVPALNAQIQGDEIVQNHFYDIGVAVGTEAGLVVPVIRDADRLSFAEVERTIATYAKKARERKLTLGDLTGGSFTISNGGVYGSMLSTPILNPPQSGILGMHATRRRPVAVGDAIEIRPMMYLALSYDHRLVDGKEAVTFLKRIVHCIEDPERMMLEV